MPTQQEKSFTHFSPGSVPDLSQEVDICSRRDWEDKKVAPKIKFSVLRVVCVFRSLSIFRRNWRLLTVYRVFARNVSPRISLNRSEQVEDIQKILKSFWLQNTSPAQRIKESCSQVECYVLATLVLQ